MSAEEILSSKAQAIEALCGKYGVKRLRVFGSAVQGTWNPEKSDFDLLAEFDWTIPMPALRQLVGFKEEMEELLGRSVDIVDWNAAKNPFFRRNAEKHAKDLYAA